MNNETTKQIEQEAFELYPPLSGDLLDVHEHTARAYDNLQRNLRLAYIAGRTKSLAELTELRAEIERLKRKNAEIKEMQDLPITWKKE